MLDLERFKRQIDYCTLPNGTCTDLALQTKGRYDDTSAFDFMARMGIWFENFALPVVINECLMQSYTGIIRLFPNWPEDMNASFQTLRAVGAFLVSCERKDSRIQSLIIESEKGGTCRLHNPWSKASVTVSKGNEAVKVSHQDDAIAFETESGWLYELSEG